MPPLTIILMAKAAVPGRVKTRLAAALGPEAAARVHEAMFDCVLERLAGAFPAATRVLAMDRLGLAPTACPAPEGWGLREQGAGDLGDRIGRAWQAVEGPALFFGIDSPDVPRAALAALPRLLETHDAVAGPVDDGGYWTLGGRRPAPALWRRIDWGTGRVYDQTREAAERAGLTLAAAPAWFDVDETADLDALLDRIGTTQEPALQRLARRLRAATAPGRTPPP